MLIGHLINFVRIWKQNESNPALISKHWPGKQWSIYIRRKDADWRGYARCFTCRRQYLWKELQAGHFKHGKLDFHPLNIHPQCVRCNKWLHGNLDSYSLWLTKTYGPEISETIDVLVRDEKILTSQDLQAIYLKYKQLNSSSSVST